MDKNNYWIILFFFILLTSCRQDESEIGKPYKGWEKGEMDFHHIYTGRGESSFHIFPDGTTMIIDAGDWDPDDYPKMAELLPDSSRRSGEWIARYIARVNPSKDRIDYMVVSHFHKDHIGDYTNDAARTENRNPDYILTGVAEVGERFQIGKLIDRGWPDYQYPLPVNDPNVDNYRAFVNWKIAEEGLKAEQIEVGSSDQIVLLNDKQVYDDVFNVQILAANGKIWTGNNKETVNYYDIPSNQNPNLQNENTKSIAMRISYGPFSYFAGADLSGSLLDEGGDAVNMEEEVAKICGPVNVCKANHHAFKDAMTEGFLKNIKASSYIIPVWDHEHIQPEVLGRIVSLSSGNPDLMIFPTRFPEILRNIYSGEKWINSVNPSDGHIVVKVLNGGHEYKIYTLSAQNESQIVKSVHGPYSTVLICN